MSRPIKEAPTYSSDVLNIAARFSALDLPDSDNRSRILHVSGLIARREERYDHSVALLSRALRFASGRNAVLIDLAQSLGRAGRHRAGRAALERAVAIERSNPDGWCALGLALIREGKLAEAEEAARVAADLAPTNPEARCVLAHCFLLRECLDDAARCFEEARTLAPEMASSHLGLGRVCLKRRDWGAGAAHFQVGLTYQPYNSALLVALGYAHLRLGRHREAFEALRLAAEASPEALSVWRQMICVLEVAQLDTDAADAWLELGAALARSSRYDEACAAFRAALTHRPESVRGRTGLGRALLYDGQPVQAIHVLQGLLERHPNHWLAHTELGRAFQTVNDVARGWTEFLWFCRPGHGEAQALEQPTWDGSPLEGRTILVQLDRALGDSIQLLRYVGIVKERGGRVVIECPPRLVSLLAHVDIFDQVIATGAPLPSLDVHIPLIRLPTLLGMEGNVLPERIPYLRVGQELIETWRRRLGADGRLLVGLSWGGNRGNIDAMRRFMSLRAFAALARTERVRFISLQMGLQAAELLADPPYLDIDTPQDERCSLADTAALMESLDVIVTVDTMVAHLAGALGRRVWTLLPFVADWRWLQSVDSCTWYPTMALFRQSRRGDWGEVAKRVRRELDRLADRLAIAKEVRHLERA